MALQSSAATTGSRECHSHPRSRMPLILTTKAVVVVGIDRCTLDNARSHGQSATTIASPSVSSFLFGCLAVALPLHRVMCVCAIAQAESAFPSTRLTIAFPSAPASASALLLIQFQIPVCQ